MLEVELEELELLLELELLELELEDDPPPPQEVTKIAKKRLQIILFTFIGIRSLKLGLHYCLIYWVLI